MPTTTKNKDQKRSLDSAVQDAWQEIAGALERLEPHESALLVLAQPMQENRRPSTGGLSLALVKAAPIATSDVGVKSGMKAVGESRVRENPAIGEASAARSELPPAS